MDDGERTGDFSKPLGFPELPGRTKQNVTQAVINRQVERYRGMVPVEFHKAAEDKLVDKIALEEMNCHLPDSPRSTFLMVFSPDGKKVASTHGNHNVYVTDLTTGKNIRTLSGHPRTPWCIAFHPSSNQILATGCLGGQVRVWDLTGGSEVWTAENQTVIASLAFHPIDRMLVIATFNELLFWDWSQPEPFAKRSTKTDKEKVRYVTFDRLGNKLITGIANPNQFQSQWDRVGVPSFTHAPSSSVSSAPTTAGGSARVSVNLASSDRERSIAFCYRTLMNQYNQLVRRYFNLSRTRVTPTMDRGTDPMDMVDAQNQPGTGRWTVNSMPTAEPPPEPDLEVEPELQPPISSDDSAPVALTSSSENHNGNEPPPTTETETPNPDIPTTSSISSLFLSPAWFASLEQNGATPTAATTSSTTTTTEPTYASLGLRASPRETPRRESPGPYSTDHLRALLREVINGTSRIRNSESQSSEEADVETTEGETRSDSPRAVVSSSSSDHPRPVPRFQLRPRLLQDPSYQMRFLSHVTRDTPRRFIVRPVGQFVLSRHSNSPFQPRIAHRWDAGTARPPAAPNPPLTPQSPPARPPPTPLSPSPPPISAQSDATPTSPPQPPICSLIIPTPPPLPATGPTIPSQSSSFTPTSPRGRAQGSHSDRVDRIRHLYDRCRMFLRESADQPASDTTTNYSSLAREPGEEAGPDISWDSDSETLIIRPRPSTTSTPPNVYVWQMGRDSTAAATTAPSDTQLPRPVSPPAEETPAAATGGASSTGAVPSFRDCIESLSQQIERMQRLVRNRMQTLYRVEERALMQNVRVLLGVRHRDGTILTTEFDSATLPGSQESTSSTQEPTASGTQSSPTPAPQEPSTSDMQETSASTARPTLQDLGFEQDLCGQIRRLRVVIHALRVGVEGTVRGRDSSVPSVSSMLQNTSLNDELNTAATSESSPPSMNFTFLPACRKLATFMARDLLSQRNERIEPQPGPSSAPERGSEESEAAERRLQEVLTQVLHDSTVHWEESLGESPEPTPPHSGRRLHSEASQNEQDRRRSVLRNALRTRAHKRHVQAVLRSRGRDIRELSSSDVVNLRLCGLSSRILLAEESLRRARQQYCRRALSRRLSTLPPPRTDRPRTGTSDEACRSCGYKRGTGSSLKRKGTNPQRFRGEKYTRDGNGERRNPETPTRHSVSVHTPNPVEPNQLPESTWNLSSSARVRQPSNAPRTVTLYCKNAMAARDMATSRAAVPENDPARSPRGDRRASLDSTTPPRPVGRRLSEPSDWSSDDNGEDSSSPADGSFAATAGGSTSAEPQPSTSTAGEGQGEQNPRQGAVKELKIMIDRMRMMVRCQREAFNGSSQLTALTEDETIMLTALNALVEHAGLPAGVTFTPAHIRAVRRDIAQLRAHRLLDSIVRGVTSFFENNAGHVVDREIMKLYTLLQLALELTDLLLDHVRATLLRLDLARSRPAATTLAQSSSVSTPSQTSGISTRSQNIRIATTRSESVVTLTPNSGLGASVPSDTSRLTLSARIRERQRLLRRQRELDLHRTGGITNFFYPALTGNPPLRSNMSSRSDLQSRMEHTRIMRSSGVPAQLHSSRPFPRTGAVDIDIDRRSRISAPLQSSGVSTISLNSGESTSLRANPYFGMAPGFHPPLIATTAQPPLPTETGSSFSATPSLGDSSSSSTFGPDRPTRRIGSMRIRNCTVRLRDHGRAFNRLVERYRSAEDHDEPSVLRPIRDENPGNWPVETAPPREVFIGSLGLGPSSRRTSLLSRPPRNDSMSPPPRGAAIWDSDDPPPRSNAGSVFNVPVVHVEPFPQPEPGEPEAPDYAPPPRLLRPPYESNEEVRWRQWRPRFLNPRYGGPNPFDEQDLDPPALYRGSFVQPGLYAMDMVTEPPQATHHRIQAWDFSRQVIPDISDRDLNGVVRECKIHNDASVDISSDGQLLVTLLPSGRLSATTMLGVYSLDWNSLGQLLYKTGFEHNAVSVSLSPTNRHLLVGLASRPLVIRDRDRDRTNMAQIYRLEGARVDPPSGTWNGTGILRLVRNLQQPRDTNAVSLNCIRWAPGPGQGLIYGTNAGQLKVLR